MMDDLLTHTALTPSPSLYSRSGGQLPYPLPMLGEGGSSGTDEERRTRSKPGQRRKFSKDRPPDPHGVEMPWRLFLAIPMPQLVIERMEKIITRLSTKGWPVRWTDLKTAHLTIHFIGDVESSQAELLRMALPAAVAKHEAFSLETGRLGVFPSEKKPRVLWMGLDGENERLTALHRDLGALLTSFEFEVDARPFSPHITLGRLREEIGAARAMEIWTTFRGYETGTPLELPVEEVILVRSYINRDGTRHEPLVRCPLTKQAADSRPQTASSDVAP